MDNPRYAVREPGLGGFQRGAIYASSHGELPLDAAHAFGVRHDPSAHPDVPLGSSDHVVGEADPS